ncbi:MAG TPA: hypothetical protein VIL00_09880 [Pseudonocardiaceae bacterium]
MNIRARLAATAAAVLATTAVGVGSTMWAPEAHAGTVRTICAQDVYVRDAPAGVVIGTLYRGQHFELSRYSDNGAWAYGYAMGHAQKRGWILASAMC